MKSSKAEHNPFTGVEYAPSAQLVWRLSNRRQILVSAARTTREPNRSDVGIEAIAGSVPLADGGSATLEIFGQTQRDSETLRDFELGYRTQISPKLSLDVATFFSLYRNLLETLPGNPYFTPVPVPHLVVPIYFADVGRGRSYGGEIFATWYVTSRWRIVPSYSFIHINVNWTAAETDATGNTDTTTPRHEIKLQSLFNVTRNREWDTTFAWNAALSSAAGQLVPAYARLDMRLAKRIAHSLFTFRKPASAS